MNPPDNAKILNDLIRSKDLRKGVELGVRRGEFSTYLLQENPMLHMTCVDLWEQDPSMNEKHPHDANYLVYRANTSPYKDRITEYKMLLDDAVKQVEDYSLDFVFIDATHTYDAVKNDYYTWAPKVRLGGLICGHDYHPAFDNGGIIRFVEEISPNIEKLSNQELVLDRLKSMTDCVDIISTCWYTWKMR
jgi:predicted O-methyltransferase YrrM